MSDCIWLCEKSTGIGQPWGFFPDTNRGADQEAEVRATYDIIRRISDGESIPKNEMHDRFFHSGAEFFDKKIPDFFITQHFFFKQSIVDIIQKFDMGGGYFQPTHFYQWDRATLIADDVFVMCPGNAKETVNVEQTDGISVDFPNILKLPFTLDDGAVVTNRQAMGGPDVWVDPRFNGTYFFLSARLADALIAAGLKKRLGLVATKTI